MKFLCFFAFLCSFCELSAGLTCVPPDQSTANITSWVSKDPSLSLTVRNQTLNVSYCVDVINWPISNETLNNFKYYDQGC